MMDDAKQGMLMCIIVKDFSRFGRDHLETGNYLERIFPLLGIRFISVNDQFDSEDCQGMTGGMSVALKNIINSMYSRDLSKKVCTAMTTRAGRGEYMAAFPPYGYMKDPKDVHRLIPDDEAAEIVRLIFSMAAEGKKKPEIARYLNEGNIPTAIEHMNSIGVRKKPCVDKKKKIWTVTTIGDMLKNEVYLGKTIWNKSRMAAVGSHKQIRNDRSEWIIMEGTHEPLISQELYDRANALAFTHVKRNSQNGRKAQPVLFCAYCGRRLTLTSWGNAYRCGQAAISGIPECKSIHVDKKMFEDIVLSCTRSMVGIVAEETARKKKEWSKISPITEKIRRREAEQKRLSARKLRLYEDYRSGNISKDQYCREYEKTSNRIFEIKREIPQLKAEITNIRQKKLEAKESETELKELAVLDTFDKEKLSRVIDNVQVYSADRIELVWKTDNCFAKELVGNKELLSLHETE